MDNKEHLEKLERTVAWCADELMICEVYEKTYSKAHLVEVMRKVSEYLDEALEGNYILCND